MNFIQRLLCFLTKHNLHKEKDLHIGGSIPGPGRCSQNELKER